MNILFISALEGGKYSGTLYSVPKQVEAQSKIDNVYWVNLTKIDTTPLTNKALYHYMSVKDFSLDKLPTPFNKPDIIIFEEYFKIECCLVARKCEKRNIPYIIIPRCQMTNQYLINKKWKKKLACILMFNHFANKAKAVHFLSHQEKEDSKKFYSGRSFIEGNGIEIPDIMSKDNHKKEKTGVFIGRYSIWQKGLDILIEAIHIKRDVLKTYGIKFNFYGPNERTGSMDKIQKLVDDFQVNDLITVNGPVFGKDKQDVLLNCDFFIHTSRFEGMPMAVLEALSYSIPCLVSQGSNMRELIEELDAGWGSETSVQSIASRLEDIAKEEDGWREKRQHALYAAKKFSWEQIALRCHQQYEELLK